MPEVSVTYTAPPTLSEFGRSNAFIRCCIGPVGSGKSSACVIEILRRASEQAPLSDGKRRTRFAVIRNTYRELEDTTRKTFQKWVQVPPQAWKESEFEALIKFRDVECEVLFRSLNRPGDIGKLLSLELTGAYINEVREVPKAVLDMLTSRVGRYPSPDEGGPTWRGIWMDTNPWHSGHWGQRFFENVASVPRELLDELGCKEPKDFARCFRQPGARTPRAENLKNLIPGYYAQQMIGKDSEWIRVYIDGEDARAAEGSVYGALVSMLRQREGVSGFHHGTDEVFTAWDLGRADMTSIWWFRFNEKRGVDIIDFYENHNEWVMHYCDVIEAKPYRYARHFLPHDARAQTLQAQHSTIEQVHEWTQKETARLGGVAIAPPLDVDKGIEAARWLLEQRATRFHSRCDVIPPNAEYSGLGLLAEYRYEFDEIRKVFSRTPLHNFSSHAADAFRYLACAVRQSDLLTQPPVVAKEKSLDIRALPLNEIWKLAPMHKRDRA